MMDHVPDYQSVLRVLPQDVDFAGRMRPAALLANTQQVATDHCTSFGLDSALYAATHTAFLLARQALEFYRVPGVNEMLTYKTMPEGPRRALYKRITDVLDESGSLVARVDSRWVLVDTNTWRILRRPPAGLNVPWPERVEPELDLTIRKAEAPGEPVPHIARYSQCDEYGHLNNARWVDLLCDALPMEVLQAGPVRRVAVNYHWEVPFGHQFTLSCASNGRGWYITGQREGRCCIEAELDL